MPATSRPKPRTRSGAQADPGFVAPLAPAAVLIAFNKPFGVLCQFSGEGPTLADFIDVPDVYPAGRLDKDSEGLLLLTDDGALQAHIASPKFKLPKTYLVLVERVPEEATLERLRRGVELDGTITRPATVRQIPEPENLWPREPPVRYRKSVTDAWLELTLTEGRNRQVRRMTAAVGHPTLRLVRTAIGEFTLAGLAPGQWHRVVPPRLSGAPKGRRDG